MNRWLLLVLVFACAQPLNAQICNGSLGDPIINITFGTGTNPGAPLSAAATGYQYVSTDCPADGFYAMRNSTAGCFSSSWHSITDHTGNANGYFMLVNASIQPSAFYLDTVKGLCGNTTYEFAAWILNILKPSACGGTGIQPDLTFSMERTDGSVLQSYNTNNIPATNSPQWKQFGFFFTTPSGVTDVVLRIVNNAQGGCGNDLALDDITFRPCGPMISTSISGTSATTVAVCEGSAQSYTFTANLSAGFNDPVVQWQYNVNNNGWNDIPGGTSLTYTHHSSASASAGNYSFRLSAAESGNMGAAQCRIASTPLIVSVAQNPAASASNNGPACEGTNITLSVNASNASWSGPDGFVANGSQVIITNASASQSGKYYVTAINGSCNRTDSTMVTVKPNPVITLNTIDTLLCEGDSAELFVSGAQSYQWFPSISLSSATAPHVFAFPADTTTYAVIGKNAGLCADTLNVKVNVLSKPRANAGADKNMIEGTTVQLTGSASGDSISYYWSPLYHISGAQLLTPVISPVVDTSYILHVISGAGCGTDSDTVNIHVFKKLQIPNAFSPNKDGINDNWRINGIETYPGAEVIIFDRYGRQVFYSRRFIGWDGRCQNKQLPAGTYYYRIQALPDAAALSGWIQLLY